MYSRNNESQNELIESPKINNFFIKKQNPKEKTSGFCLPLNLNNYNVFYY